MYRLLTAVAVIVLSTTLAQAHPGDTAHDLAHGLMHPISGLDHGLAMVAVGMIAAQLGGRALWLVPAAFVVTMSVAAAFGAAGMALPRIELGIAASVVVLGALVALRLGMPVSLAMGVVGVFAIFHGIAHGAEMPPTVSGLGYGIGFIAATALMHAAGIGMGLLLGTFGRSTGRYAMRMLGATTAAIGGVMIIAAL